MTSSSRLEASWAAHDQAWRDPAQITAHWAEAGNIDPGLLTISARGAWWELLSDLGITLLITREYEHLAVAICVRNSRPQLTFMRIPHPSGLAVERERGVVHVASTRNPNQVLELRPVQGLEERGDLPPLNADERPLVPVQARFYPGCLYIHDLALIGGALHASASGQNAVVSLAGDVHRVTWWPRSVERANGVPDTSRNYIQLNSIAAGTDLESSFFSASSERPSARRPGHRNFPVDGRGVVFSGSTREPVAAGLTRPHSVRLQAGSLWVANSGYGEISIISNGYPEAVVRLPGWTRGLAFCGDYLFVGTSRVIPRFRRYAPGLDVDASICGVHAVDIRNGRIVGSVEWPNGNQIFALEWLPTHVSAGFPIPAGRRRPTRQLRSLFYAFSTAEGVRRAR